MYFFYYYPIGVDVRRPRVPWVTLSVMLTCTVVYLLSGPFSYLNHVNWGAYVYRPALLDYLTPLTAMFLHGSWMHLLGNLLYLWVFGPALEGALGRLGFVIVLVGTGYLGNLAHGALVMQTDASAMWRGVVGASGAISGLLGMFLLRFPYANVRLAWWAFLPLQGINKAGVAELPSTVGVALWVLMQLVFILVEGPTSGTAYGAHLGGLLTGGVLALALRMPLKARVERMKAKGFRFLRKGNAHAAVGWLERYLGRAPWDDEAWLELARAKRVAGDVSGATRVYRRYVRDEMKANRSAKACSAYAEARRGDPFFHLDLPSQRRIAFWLEKSGSFGPAVSAYLDIARFNVDDPESVHALVRAATLSVTRLDKPSHGLELLEEALARFPDHPMREVLEQERRHLLRNALGGRAA